jgi:hypothetical protein
MATRAMETQLPPEIRTELEQRLIENGFANYAELHEWLSEKGVSFGLSTVKRFGKRFEQRCEMVRLATQQADMMRQHFGDDEQAMSEASLQMAQSRMFYLMLERGEEMTAKEISLITRALSDTTRASVAVKNYQANLRDKVEAKLQELEKQGSGLSPTSIDPHTLRRVREEIYGLF